VSFEMQVVDITSGVCNIEQLELCERVLFASLNLTTGQDAQ